MRKILPVFLVALLFLVFHTSVLAAPVDINAVISTTTNQPTGDCVGPDDKHFQATQTVCDTFNKAWGKKTTSFNVGQPSPLPQTTPIATVIAQAEANGSPLIDCVGPDKKHLNVAKEVCDKLNMDWKKTPPAPIVIGVVVPNDLSQTINTSLSKGSPLGDCVGPDKKHFDATKEVCDAFNKNWGKATSFDPGKTTGVGIQSAIVVVRSTGSSNAGATGGVSGQGGSNSSGGKSSRSSVGKSGASKNSVSNTSKNSSKNGSKSNSKKD